MSSAAQILRDIHTELESSFLEDDFIVRGRTYRMRLLNDHEAGWSYNKSHYQTELGLAFNVRRAQLAIGIRSIDGATPEELFKEAVESRSKEDLLELMKISNNNEKEFYANMMLEFLNEFTTDYIDDLHSKWRELETRQSMAQGELKNSSEETLESEEKTS